MTQPANVQEAAVASTQEVVKQLARHLEQQTESVRASHKLIKRLQVASLILPVAAVVVAVVVIASSANFSKAAIPAALFAIPASFALWLLLVGVHSVIIKAFPPLEFLVKGMKGMSGPLGLYTGQPAVRWGVFVMVAAVAGGALWGMGAYAFINPDILNILIPCIIVVLIGAGLWASWLQKQNRK
jgi:hypothetical protein